jgi:integrating conjugative element protein (TIGR03756 family)
MKKNIMASILCLLGLTMSQGFTATKPKKPKTTPLNIATLAVDQNSALIQNPFGNYFNYKVEGECMWMLMTPYGPVYSYTMFVKHFLPDLLISVFRNKESDPLKTYQVVDKAMDKIGQATYKLYSSEITGTGHVGDNPTTDMDRFYDVNVIGNPAISEFKTGFATHKAVTTPYAIYYSSLLDQLLWHNPEPELLLHPTALLPFFNNEGSMFAPWGSLYPRYGVVTQFSKYKAAGVIALRASHIATHKGQSHLYNKAKTGATACGVMCKVSASMINKPNDIEFQLVYPLDKTFIYNKKDIGYNDTIPASVHDFTHSYKSEETKEGGDNYAWLLWRKYEGCLPGKGALVGVIRY